MKLVRKHFQIRDDQLEKIQKLLKPGVSESHVVREALDHYFKSNESKEEK